MASGRKLIGGEDWFAQGALAVLQAQQRDGSIPLGHWGGSVGGTCFCTLFLVYGGAPVAVNKLQFGKGQDWNLNPRDLANLSKALWTAYERPINWQIVSIDAPAAEIEAPILFLSGSQKWDYTETEMLKLREYIERGGTILAEPSDHSPDFAASMERLLKDMYPPQTYPDVRLAALPADHPVYTVIKHEWKKRPKLRGASNGSRTFFLLSDEYMSGDWQANREESDAFQLAMNLLFYATDLGELEGKFTSILPTTPPAKAKAGNLTVARVRHNGTEGHPQDWEAAARCWHEAGAAGQARDRPDLQGSGAGRPRQGLAGRREAAAPDRPHRPDVHRGRAHGPEEVRRGRRHGPGGSTRRLSGLCQGRPQGAGSAVRPAQAVVGRSGAGRRQIRGRRGH